MKGQLLMELEAPELAQASLAGQGKICQQSRQIFPLIKNIICGCWKRPAQREPYLPWIFQSLKSKMEADSAVSNAEKSQLADAGNHAGLSEGNRSV